MSLSDVFDFDSNSSAENEDWLASLDKRLLDAFTSLLAVEISLMGKKGYSEAWEALAGWSDDNGCPDRELLPYVWIKGASKPT